MNTSRIARTALAVVGALGVTASIAACGGQVASADVGACINSADVSGDEITDIPTVDCSEEHDAQVFFKFDMDDGDFPGNEAVSTAAQEKCIPAFGDFVGTDYQESSLDIRFIGPSQDTWDQADDREVICFLVTMDGSTSTESFEGSGL